MQKMQELHAGYVCSVLWEKVLRKELDPSLDWQRILRGLAHFVINEEIKPAAELSPVVTVLENMIGRGLPTLPSLRIERAMAECTSLFSITTEGLTLDTQTYKTTFTSSFEDIKSALEQALCIKSEKANQSEAAAFPLPAFDSQAEVQFFSGPLTQALGKAIQLVERQRPFESISTEKGFDDQRLDYCIEYPGAKDNTDRGIIIELDGPDHHTSAQKDLDGRRDRVSLKAGWKTIRIPASDSLAPLSNPIIQSALSHPYIARIREETDISSRDGAYRKNALDLIITPLAIARIQKVLIQLIHSGCLHLDSPSWRICVIENEMPCGQIACEDLLDWLKMLHALYSPGTTLPIIDVTAVASGDVDALKRAEARGKQQPFDVLMDVSVLQRYGIATFLPAIPAKHCLSIRSAYREESSPELRPGPILVPQIVNEAEEKVLRFFLNNIFRKNDFREGQLSIIRRTLRGSSSIALLPTGAGKSLTYQLSGLLQNGLVVIIDPIKSLMKDRVDNLSALGVDSAAFINSSMKAIKRKQVGDAFAHGAYKFTFVSPERLLIDEFRVQLTSMEDHHFCFAVVDEAHCVSEWGHDFRTAYLRLGENLRRYAVSADREVPILALTGTASYEVLEDIQRELQLSGGEEDIIRPEKMARDELNFKVVPLDPFPVVPHNAKPIDVSKLVAKAKQDILPTILNEIASRFEKSFEQLTDSSQADHGTGLVFCPHVKWEHGVVAIRDSLSMCYPSMKERMGVYAGSLSSDVGDGAMVKVQDDFKSSVTTVLACTKAFGMGIDKPNIRFTVHFNFPLSIEAFYQEAGRAGRDRQAAYCYILYGGGQTPEHSSIDKSLMQSFINNSFRGQEHEEQMIFDLLDEIRVPSQSACARLSDYLVEEFGIQIKSNPFPRINPSFIYVNNMENGSKLGRINLRSKAIEEIHQSDRDALEVMPAAIKWLEANCDASLSLSAWVGLNMPGEKKMGLEEILGSLKVGGSVLVNVPFDNGLVSELAQYLSRDRKEWNETMVAKAYDFAFTSDDFARHLNSEYWKKTKAQANLTDDTLERISATFPHIRIDAYTFKVVYRLAILGIIDDYTYDYRSRTITIKLTRQPDGAVSKNLQEYIGRYEDSVTTSRVLDEIHNMEAPTELRRAARRLVAFVYSKIKSKRDEALSTMETTTKRGIEDPDVFRDDVYDYFDSRFTNKLRLYTHEYYSKTVISILQDVGSSPHDVSHLLGSCNRLLNENPQNALFHILRACAMAMSRVYIEADVERELADGLRLFRRREGWDMTNEQQLLGWLLDYIRNADETRLAPFAAALVNCHARWLNAFTDGVEKGGFAHV